MCVAGVGGDGEGEEVEFADAGVRIGLPGLFTLWGAVRRRGSFAQEKGGERPTMLRMWDLMESEGILL